MIPGKKGRTVGALLGALLCGLFAVSPLRGYDKKLRVVADYTHVYLQPDEGSSVVDTVERGAVLSLLYSGKMRKVWYYICFKSEKSGITKSGYVLDSEVELLFDPLRTITIQEDNETMKVQYTPRNFEEMHWGLTKKQVVESEGKPFSQTRVKGRDVLIYQQRVFNLDCDIEYLFTGNKLIQTKFSFAGDSQDKSVCLDNYRKIKETLIRKFGKPVEENMNWLDSSYKEDFLAWGEAVSQGQLELSSRWLTSQSEIAASLAGKNEAISLVVLFTGLQLREVARKSQESD